MGIKEYSKLILTKDKINIKTYLFIIIIQTAIIFNGITLIENPVLESINDLLKTISPPKGIHGLPEETFAPVWLHQKQSLLYMILFMVVFTCIVNYYFTRKKYKQAGFALLNGASLSDLVRFFIVQNGGVFIIASFIGALIGALISPLCNMLLYSLLKTDGPILTFTFYSLSILVGIIFIEFLYLIVFSFSYVYRNNLLKLVNVDDNIQVINFNKISFLGVISIILYFVPLMYIIFSPTVNNIEGAYYVAASISIIGMYFICKKGLSTILYFFKKSTIFEKHKIIYINTFAQLVSKCTPFFLVLTGVYWYYLGEIGSRKEVVSLVPVYILSLLFLNVIICGTLFYKLTIEIKYKKTVHNKLLLLGYSKESIKKLTSKELLSFMFLGISLPTLIASIMTLGYFKAGALNSNYAFLLLCTLIIPIIIVFISIHYYYIKNLFNKEESYEFNTEN